MAEVNEKNGLQDYVDGKLFKFKNVTKDAQVEFAFEFKKSAEEIDYIDPGCGCTKAWYEDGRIKGILSIDKVGQLQPGENAVNKIVTVMLDPGIPYLVGGKKKEKVVNDEKRFFRLSLSGTSYVGTLPS